MPEISVVMAAYNAELYIVEAVESILQQVYADFELIIINDGSTDKTTEILREFTSQDSRIVLLEQNNKGLVSSLNKGIQISKGSLIARMDADDVANINRFSAQVDFFKDNPDVAVLGSAVTIIDEKGEHIGTSSYPLDCERAKKYLYQVGSPFAHSSVMMRKEAFTQAGGYRSAYRHAEDYDLWLRISKWGCLNNLQEPLVKLRRHPSSISFLNIHEQAIRSVVAKCAAESPIDPTDDIEFIDKESLKLFSVDQNFLEWQVSNMMCGTLLAMPDNDLLSYVIKNLPNSVVSAATFERSSVYLKIALIQKKLGRMNYFYHYFLKSFSGSPSSFVKLIASYFQRKFARELV